MHYTKPGYTEEKEQPRSTSVCLLALYDCTNTTILAMREQSKTWEIRKRLDRLKQKQDMLEIKRKRTKAGKSKQHRQVHDNASKCIFGTFAPVLKDVHL